MSDEVTHETAPRTEYKGSVGKLNFMLMNGRASECAVKLFIGSYPDKQLNEWGAANPNCVIVHMEGNESYIRIGYTLVLDEQEIQDRQEVAFIVEQELQKLRAQRAAAKQSEDDARAKAEAERNRLADVGRKCESNHKKAEVKPGKKGK